MEEPKAKRPWVKLWTDQSFQILVGAVILGCVSAAVGYHEGLAASLGALAGHSMGKGGSE
jgi:hypothetical protein